MSAIRSHFGRVSARCRYSAAFAASLAIGAACMPAAAQAPSLSLLEGLTKGEWEIRFRDGAPSQKLCVRSGYEFVRIQHKGHTCTQQSVKAGSGDVVVQYKCAGGGFGRTKIRRETPALIQIDGHGIADGSPYQFVAEARHTGRCN